MSTLSSILINSFLITKCFSASWGYLDHEALDDTANWKNTWAECGYSRQSPIDITIDEYQCKEPLLLEWTSQIQHYAIRNNGHSLQAMPFAINNAGGGDFSSLEVLHHKNDTNIKLQNSFYNTYESQRNKEYCFDSLHFHWGVDNEHGSEHTINGNGYPLEVHFVHYACDYEAAGDALVDYSTGSANYNHDDDNILAVIGVIFEIGDPNPVLAKILDDVIIDGIFQNHGGITSNNKLLDLYYTEFELGDLLPESREMIAYLGSLTTPPCYETVRWHVMKDTMTVSQEQMDMFRLLLTSSNVNDSMAPNFRPVQPLNDRTIYQCGEDIADNDELYMDKDVEEDTADVKRKKLNKVGRMWRIIALTFVVIWVVALLLCCISHRKETKFGGTPRHPEGNNLEAHHQQNRSVSDIQEIGGNNTHSSIHHL